MDNQKTPDKARLGIFERMQQSRAERKAKYEEKVAQERKRRFGILSGNLTDVPTSVHLKDGEKAYHMFSTQRYADSDYVETYTSGTDKKKGVVGRAFVGNILFGPAGAIIGGVTAGSKNQSTTTQQKIVRTEPIDSGDILFTNKRVLFVGKEIIEIPYAEILSVSYEDVILEHKERIPMMYIKYSSMLKGECYAVENNGDTALYYQGLMRLIGRDKTTIKEADIKVDGTSFEGLEFLRLIGFILLILVVIGAIYGVITHWNATTSEALGVISLLLMICSFVCIFVGMIVPAAFTGLFKKNLGRKTTGLVFAGTTLALLILSMVLIVNSPKSSGNSPQENSGTATTNTGIVQPSITIMPTPTPEPCADQIGTKNYASCEVTLQTQDELSRPLNVTVRADNNAVYITNPASTKLAQCDVTVGTDPTADNYISDGFVVNAGQTVDVGWGNMANEENQRFNYYTTKPDSVSIACTVGGTTNKDGSYTGGETHRSNFNF